MRPKFNRVRRWKIVTAEFLLRQNKLLSVETMTVISNDFIWSVFGYLRFLKMSGSAAHNVLNVSEH